jgi:hypothetical protein
MKENAIIILVRGSLLDIKELNCCLESINLHLKETLLDADIILFHESQFEPYKSQIVIPNSEYFPAIYYSEISLEIPNYYSSKVRKSIPTYFPHPTDSRHPGFSIGYRSMCRFFSGEVFTSPTLQRYLYLMRLDTDSSFIKGAEFSLFKWANQHKIKYGFIKSSIQWDHPMVSESFKNTALRILFTLKIKYFIRGLMVPSERMYYTNFEIMYLPFFASNNWQYFFRKIDLTGGFYLRRWGDAIIRYMGVKSMVSKKERMEIPNGFIYKHGGTFDSGARLSRRTYFLKNQNRLGKP